jgi:hypothetical protein
MACKAGSRPAQGPHRIGRERPQARRASRGPARMVSSRKPQPPNAGRAVETLTASRRRMHRCCPRPLAPAAPPLAPSRQANERPLLRRHRRRLRSAMCRGRSTAAPGRSVPMDASHRPADNRPSLARACRSLSIGDPRRRSRRGGRMSRPAPLPRWPAGDGRRDQAKLCRGDSRRLAEHARRLPPRMRTDDPILPPHSSGISLRRESKRPVRPASRSAPRRSRGIPLRIERRRRANDRRLRIRVAAPPAPAAP